MFVRRSYLGSLSQMLERIVYLMFVLVAAGWLAGVLARLAPQLAVLVVLALVLRWTWWYTR